MSSIGLIFDGVMAVVLIFFMYRGIKRGFSGEIIGLVGLTVGIFCALNFLEPAVNLFYKYVDAPSLDKNIVSLICAVAIFFAVEIVFALISAVLSYLVKVTKLSLMDHFFGMLIGIIKTAFIVIFIYAVMSMFSNVLPSDWVNDSYCMKGAKIVWPYCRDVLQSHGILDFSTLTGVK
ncbi:MAG: CvpA family protein [Synergistaceae bacterium]|nr:CvpA family protein [Synergistaceae bacterium]MBR0233574.1 CvpA family protein [Synergistaceae bacterium]